MSEPVSQIKTTPEQVAKELGDYTKWTYNGHTFDLDLTDVDVAENYEKCFDRMEAEEKTALKAGPNSEVLKSTYTVFQHLFDGLLGEGATEKITGGKRSVKVIMAAYNDFISFVSRQSDANKAMTKAYSESYSNRAQRRAAARKSK